MSAFDARADEPEDEGAGEGTELGRARAEERAGEGADLRRALDEERARALRLLADFENFRRREKQEREAAFAAGRRAALLPFLPALDALERALATEGTAGDLRDGVALTQRMLRQALHEVGAEPVATVGRPLDPTVHEAVAAIPSDEAPPGTVVREIRGGWKLGTDLLRPAQVEVAAPSGPEPWR